MIRLRVRDADGERVFESDADSPTLGPDDDVRFGVLDSVPPGFLDQVWSAVQEHVHYPERMRTMMQRARVLEPRVRAMATYGYLVTNRLPPEETRNDVPRSFAIRVIAENPHRFRFS